VNKKLHFDALVIGGGFYGAMVALRLSKNHKLEKIAILERNPKIFSKASLNNQYRVHGGYHYPRSFNTANRSRINFSKFLRDWPESINKRQTSLYAIPKAHSKINANQFLKFCRSIEAKVNPASTKQERLFNKLKFDGIYEVEECCFNPEILRKKIREDLKDRNIQTFLNTDVLSITQKSNNLLMIDSHQKDGTPLNFYSDLIYNCSYSGINQLKGDVAGPTVKLKHEIAEIVFINSPKELIGYGITVMDGPFFSILPTSNERIHSLSHVRYSPHLSWQDERDLDPYDKFNSFKKSTRFERMIRSSDKYVPVLKKSKYIGSKFEIKTMLEKNEIDDGRPILFENDKNLKNLYYVLGSKIDNIYDVLDRIDSELS